MGKTFDSVRQIPTDLTAKGILETGFFESLSGTNGGLNETE